MTFYISGQQKKLPPPLMTSEVGSFAQKTILERKPQIIRKVIADMDYPEPIVDGLQHFAREIASQPVRPLPVAAHDHAFWHTHWLKHQGKTWLQLPWYFAETYFYRRLLDIVQYFQPGEFRHRDPFLPQKELQENTAIDQLQNTWQELMEIPENVRFILLLHAALWGNRADLSNYTVTESAHLDIKAGPLQDNLLIDHSQRLDVFVKHGLRKLAFINDNVGADSLYDLVLADFLLTRELVASVDFHLKSQPFFVSDAMPLDIARVIHKLASISGPLQTLGQRLEGWIMDSRLQLHKDPFWVSCLTFKDLPAHIHQALTHADLTIVKGDVNYRRLLDDRHWSPTTRIEDVATNFPKPFLILRTLKGEIIAGLAPGQAEAIAAQDAEWLINGKRGMIQFVTE